MRCRMLGDLRVSQPNDWSRSGPRVRAGTAQVRWKSIANHRAVAANPRRERPLQERGRTRMTPATGVARMNAQRVPRKGRAWIAFETTNAPALSRGRLRERQTSPARLDSAASEGSVEETPLRACSSRGPTVKIIFGMPVRLEIGRAHV